MRKLIFILFIFAVSSSSAQGLSKTEAAKIRKVEDSMKIYGRQMIMERTALQRFMADSMFIRMLVRSLKTPNSFYYPFDSLVTVSRIYAPDSSFRIFSWQFMRDDDYYRQRAAIQMRTDDGSLKLFPLLDMSDFTKAPVDSVRNGSNWIGAIYYSMVMKTHNGKNYYTLLGYDDNNMRTTKKWLEVLTFDNQGRPVFGGPFFAIQTDDVKGSKSLARFCLEYKKEGKARMNYDKELDMIIYDHLISETNEPDKTYTMVPDGDYQGFKWVNGRWAQIDKVFDYKLQDGQAPMPLPLKDDAGKNNEQRLMEQSEKNRKLQQTPANQPAVKPPPARKNVPKRPEPKDQDLY